MLCFASLNLLVFLSVDYATAADWKIPLAGNAFRTAPGPGGNAIDGRSGKLKLLHSKELHSVYFHVDRPAELELRLLGSVTPGGTLRVVIHTDSKTQVNLSEFEKQSSSFKVQTSQSGYVRLDLEVMDAAPSTGCELTDLLVSSVTEGLKVDYVRNNDGNMYYWGRRGPSVHLSYQIPKERPLQWGYTELTVPEGQDPIGSYFMANGFSEGYFGMQVNSESERRVLFSVWSPFSTDNPKDIPADQRVELLGKGDKTRVGEFGNEGSGGQSFLIYPWKSGLTYRFLTEVKPIDDNSTQYTCWFSEVGQTWNLVASFRRPKTHTYLKGFHSFLESFDPSRGFLSRRCLYGNVWVAEAGGTWSAINQARFSVDATGSGRHRLDFEGGLDGNKFYLHNCGFFSGSVKAGTEFKLPQAVQAQPDIDFTALPR